MKRDYHPTYKSAREIQNEMELIRRLTPHTSMLNRRVNRSNPHLRMAVIASTIAGLIAVTSCFLGK